VTRLVGLGARRIASVRSWCVVEAPTGQRFCVVRAPCTNGLCDITSGKCACDANTCPHGCCSASGACEAYAQQTTSSCGSAGAACGRCANGLCDTTSGACSCDENTCPHGCCTTSGACEAYAQEALSSCGTAGARCASCGDNQATACTNGGCVCGNSVGCTGSSVCCGSGCADLETDSNNCGSCGHGCLGGACEGGFCQPVSVGPLPSGTGQGLTLDANNVYYANFQGSLYSCPKTGCTTPTTLATGLSNPNALLYDSISHDIFVADTYNNAVEAYTTGGVLSFTVTPVSGPSAFASDANYIYWGVARIGRLARFSLHWTRPRWMRQGAEACEPAHHGVPAHRSPKVPRGRSPPRPLDPWQGASDRRASCRIVENALWHPLTPQVGWRIVVGTLAAQAVVPPPASDGAGAASPSSPGSASDAAHPEKANPTRKTANLGRRLVPLRS
jgi:hypothetical protein